MPTLNAILFTALSAYSVHHVATVCPLGAPVPYDVAEANDFLCKYTHIVYDGHIEPYIKPALSHYSASPLKPWGDKATEQYFQTVVPLVDEYVTVAEQQAAKIYEVAYAKVSQLVNRLNDDSLSNSVKEKVENIVIPAGEQLDAFVDPTTPSEDVDEPTPAPEAPVERVEAKATEEDDDDVEAEWKESSAHPAASEAPDAIPETTPAPHSVGSPEAVTVTAEGKVAHAVEEAKDYIENIVADEVIEVAGEIGRNI
jgi:hypothetical protein